MRTLFITIAAVLITAVPLLSQESKQLCDTCKQPNSAENNFCTSCGARLDGQNLEQKDELPFTYREPSRLFSVSTAALIPELGIGLTFGNSFGEQERRSFLGNVSVGIGGIAELELNTGGMVGNVLAGTTQMSTWAMKVRVSSEVEGWPAIAVSLRSSNDWDGATLTSQALAASSPDYYQAGLRGLDYEMRMTTATVSLSRSVHERTTLHGTIGLSDIRHRNLGVQRLDYGFRSDPSIKRSSQWQLSGGFTITMNTRTSVILEGQTIPFFNYNVTKGELNLEHMYVGAAGIRFALGKAITLDSGIRYQSSFIGLADTQIRVALNGIFMISI